MGIKKFLVVMISILLIFGTVVPAFAAVDSSVKVEEVIRVVDTDEGKDYSEAKEKEAKISKDEAKGIAKKTLKSYFDYEVDEKKFESRIEFREDYGAIGEYTWSINWHMYNEKKSVNIDVWINANTGKVKRISKYEYDQSEDRPTIAQITQEEAKVIADDFLKKVNPEQLKEVKLEEDRYTRYRGNTNYNFIYIRQINDVQFDGNSISIEVDGIRGEVTSYSYNWDDDVDFPSLDGIVDKVKAQEAIRDNTDMTLSYIPYRNKYEYYDEQIKEIKLVYNARFESGYMVDAKEGTMIDYRGKTLEEAKVKDITDERKKEIFEKAKDIKKFDKEISEERANQAIEKYIKEIYGEGYKIEGFRYIENDDYWETSGNKAWSARFFKSDGFRRYEDGGNITINALTEELITVYKYDDYEQKIEEEYTPVITWEEGYDKAIEAIEKYFPGKIKGIDTEVKYSKSTHYYNGKEMPEMQYYFRFQRKVNGIYYGDDSLTVNIDTKEGKIRELRCKWNDTAEFPETTGIISKEDAVEIFFEDYKPELAYAKINKSGDYKNPDWETKLVYRLPFRYYRGNNIDAFTGKFLDYSGEEISEADDKFKEEIKGHDAEKELSILASQGIIDLKEFELEKEVTRTEAIKMLVDAKGYRPYMVKKAEDLKFNNIAQADANYKYLQMAIIYGILENKEGKFNGDKKITREELAEMMVNLLGYDEVAMIKDIFKVTYNDASSISKDKVGYVAICKGLDIMKDTNGKFRPKYNVTMVDMAVAIYNALGSLRN